MHFRAYFVSAVCLCFSVLAGAEGSTVNPPLTTPPVISNLVPLQQWTSKEPTSEGALVAESVLGIQMINWVRRVAGVGETGSFPGYRFMQKTDSPVVVYFPSDGRGFNFMKDWQVPSTKNYRLDVAQYSPTTPNPWGLVSDAHLVSVEVNGGRGAWADIHFVPSTTSILDKDEKAIQPAQRLHEFLGPYSPNVGGQLDQVRRQLDSAIQTAKNQSDPAYDWVRNDSSQPKDFQGFTASWNPTTHGFSMIYYQRREYRHSESIPPRGPKCSPGEVSQVYGAEYTTKLTVSAHGPVQPQSSELVSFILAKGENPGFCVPQHPPPLPHPPRCHPVDRPGKCWRQITDANGCPGYQPIPNCK